MIRFAAVTLTGVLAASSCGSAEQTRSVAPHRAEVTNGQLLLDGREWWPTGLNAYQLATDWDLNVGCGAEVDAEAYFAALPERSLTRFNAFQNLAVNKHTGELDLRAVDAVIAAAERHGQMVVPVLAAQDGACDDEVFKQRDWYVDGWTRKGSLPLSHHAWVSLLVERWSDSPSIAAWEPVGEPEPSVCDGDDCSLAARTCPDDSDAVLRGWTDAVGDLIDRADPGRLVTAGVIGGDQCGIAGTGYGLLAGSPYVDVIQYHDYDDAGFLPRRLAEVDIPVLVAEVGMRAGSCGSTGERAARLAERVDGYRTAGATGALLWAYVPDPRPDECTFDIGPHDPVLTHPAMRPGA